MAESLFENGLGTLDYILVIAVLVLSTGIGLFYAIRSKHKNARHFLVSSRNIGIFPLILSTAATTLDAITVLGQPAEAYSNGFQVIIVTTFPTLGALFSVQAILPVFFQLNINTVNQYIEYRFNRLLRIVPALLTLIQYVLVLASVTHLTATICADALRISYWASIAIICGTCTLYSSVGGFTAIIWTDVLQAVVMAASVGFIVIKGTLDEGGVSNIWNINSEGNRTIFRFSQSNETNYSIWSMTVGALVMAMGYYFNNQALLQRQMANKKIIYAKITTISVVIIVAATFAIMSWLGLVIYAHYHNCDPLLDKQITSRDQITVLFANYIFNDTKGLQGLFIAGLLAATLSTLSSYLNSASTVMIIDFVKPVFPNLKENVITICSKLMGLLYGAVVVSATLLVRNLGSIKQLVYMTAGTSLGPSTGLFILGLFFPWANSAGATSGYVCALCICWWAAIGRFQSVTSHYSLPVRTDGCNTNAFNLANQTIVNIATNNRTAFNETDSFGTLDMMQSSKNQTMLLLENHSTDEIFFLYRIVPIWYYAMAVLLVVVVGLIVSVTTGAQDPEKLDPRFISPLTWFVIRRLPVKYRKMIGFKSERFHGDMKLSYISKGFSPNDLSGTEKADLNPARENEDLSFHCNNDGGQIKSLKTLTTLSTDAREQAASPGNFSKSESILITPNGIFNVFTDIVQARDTQVLHPFQRMARTIINARG